MTRASTLAALARNYVAPMLSAGATRSSARSDFLTPFALPQIPIPNPTQPPEPPIQRLDLIFPDQLSSQLRPPLQIELAPNPPTPATPSNPHLNLAIATLTPSPQHPAPNSHVYSTVFPPPSAAPPSIAGLFILLLALIQAPPPAVPASSTSSSACPCFSNYSSSNTSTELMPFSPGSFSLPLQSTSPCF